MQLLNAVAANSMEVDFLTGHRYLNRFKYWIRPKTTLPSQGLLNEAGALNTSEVVIRITDVRPSSDD